ncbi:MAG: type II toxin-antitoxin system VapC family toxin [Caulobacterales bacterium]|jgi:ribonuclease VapC
MFLDASALCAILLDEVDGAAYAAKIREASSPRTSAIAIFETVLAVSRVVTNDVSIARQEVQKFLSLARVEIIDVGDAELDRALDAFERYGKGRHPARLNMGDCFAYACARTQGVPLLFKGDDFSRTDIAAA